jgi:hypothetical protein
MARVRVTVGYSTSTLPFATFRSMFVTDSNADVGRVSWKEPGGAPHDDAIMSFPGGDETEAFFYRQTWSQHNISAPDLRIRAIAAGCPGKYYTATPCRLVDTRNANDTYGGPALAAGADRTFPLYDRCGIPSTAQAVSVNLTVTQPSTAGYLTLYPAGLPLPLASSMNFRAGQTRSGNAIVPLNPSGELAVRCGQASGTVHFVLDVNGYLQ